MPLGFHFRMECRSFVPEGHTILAQRFNVGSGHRLGASPEGTTEPGLTASAVPSGLLDVSNAKPNAEADFFSRGLIRHGFDFDRQFFGATFAWSV